MNNKVTIVMYHYVRDLKNSRYPDIKGMDVELFEQQLQYIKEHYHVIRMEELMDAYETMDFSRLPENPLLLTFDDGYIDHYTVAYPLLKKYGMQGSFFPNAKVVKEHVLLNVNKIHFILATAPIQALVQDCFHEMDVYRENGIKLPSNESLYEELAVANRWDPGEVIFVKRLLQNRLPEDIRSEIASKLFEKYVGMSEDVFSRELYMNLDQIRCMKQGGMFFGLHGYDHYWLAKMPREQMHEDIQRALQYFDGVIDPDNWVMNYPYGNYDNDVIKYVSDAGGKLGISVEARRVNLKKDDRFALPRLDCNDLPPRGTDE